MLAIETSCDETSASVVEAKVKSQKEKVKILSNIVASQIKLHQKYGGVVPEVASRAHAEKIIPIIIEAIKNARITLVDIDLIAVTTGPGLIGSLLVGVETSKALAYSLGKPIVGISHIEGHIFSCFAGETQNSPTLRSESDIKDRRTKLKTQNLPILILTVSGGHTTLVLMKTPADYKIIGQTLDDAAGECFDKVAKLLGLGYPGGPAIAAAAAKFKAQSSKLKIKLDFKLPRSMVDSKDFNFSFSGLKTAVLYLTKKLGSAKTKKYRNIIAAELQQAIIDILVDKTLQAVRKLGINSIGLAGGVSANQLLRETMQKECLKAHRQLYMAPLELTTDNAAMIGIAAAFKALRGKSKRWYDINANANLELL